MERLEGSLDDFVLKKILDSIVEIEPKLLFELRCFGTRLKTIIDAILRDRFFLQWNISGMLGSSPPSPTAFSTCRLGNFYFCHPVLSGESLSSIALKHQTDVSTLRRVNNIISDHTLVSRTEVFVPGKIRFQNKINHYHFSGLERLFSSHLFDLAKKMIDLSTLYCSTR
jgi:hypothetical protein